MCPWVTSDIKKNTNLSLQRVAPPLSPVHMPSELPAEVTEPSIPAIVTGGNKRRRDSAKKAFDAYLTGRRVGRRPDLFIPKLSFQRLVHGTAAKFHSDLRFQQEAIDILQETAEALVVERFQKCARIAELCRMDTVRREHWQFVSNEEDVAAIPCLGRS